MNTTNSTKQYAAYIGIDWADQKHDFCLACEEQNRLKFGQIEHRPEKIHAWIAELRSQFKEGQIAIAMEQSRGALIYLLMQYDFLTLYTVNPSLVSQLRKAWKPSRAKDDPTDAALLMELARDSRHKLRAWNPQDDDTRRLGLLTESRRKAVDLRVKLTNTLRSTLKAYFPLACEVAGDKLNENMALNFLTKWPTFESLKRARRTTIEQFYRQQNSRSAQRIANRMNAILKAEPVTTDSVIVETHALQVKLLVSQLKTLRASISEYDKAITEVYAHHPENKIISSFPATGIVFGPR